MNTGEKHHQLSLALALGGGGALTVKRLIFGKKLGQGEGEKGIGEAEESGRKSQANFAFIYGVNDPDPSNHDRSLDNFLGIYAGGGGKVGLMGNDRYDRAQVFSLESIKTFTLSIGPLEALPLGNSTKTGGIDIQGEGFFFLPFFGLDVDFGNAWSSLFWLQKQGGHR